MSKDAYYFKHDSNAKSDPNMLMCRAKYGSAGYGNYFMIVEMLRDESDYRIPISKHVYASIGITTGQTPKEAKAFVDDLVNEFSLLSRDRKFIWSESLLRRMEGLDTLRAKRAEAGRSGGIVRSQRIHSARERGTHDRSEWIDMVETLEGRCVKCFSSATKMSKDHIIPLYQGGDDSIRNIQPLCRLCNSAKGSDSEDLRPAALKELGKQMPIKWKAKSKQKASSKINPPNYTPIEHKSFNPPTLDDVKAYAKGRKSAFSAQKFFDQYESVGWVKASGAPVRDWKATWRTWEGRESAEDAAARGKEGAAKARAVKACATCSQKAPEPFSLFCKGCGWCGPCDRADRKPGDPKKLKANPKGHGAICPECLAGLKAAAQ